MKCSLASAAAFVLSALHIVSAAPEPNKPVTEQLTLASHMIRRPWRQTLCSLQTRPAANLARYRKTARGLAASARRQLSIDGSVWSPLD
ncbi:hypothetical protein AAE478_006548 [Parahypoxylon ruwenzoriense]